MSQARIVVLALAVGVILPLGAFAQIPGAASESFTDDTAEVKFEIATYELDVTLTFEDVIGLDAANLGLSVDLVSSLDTTLLARLPGTLVSVPVAFPVMLTVEPPSTGGLSFSGLCTLELHTHDLQFTTNSPLRLFRAPVGGSFEDITESMGTGSYRARGQVGDFSQFLILVEGRTDAQVIGGKFDRLESLLDELDGTIPASVATDLEADLTAAQAAWTSGNASAAIADLEDLVATVKANAGSGIPEIWRSARDLTNVAGELRAAAATLIFSLRLTV